jgi:hypothetical protein
MAPARNAVDSETQKEIVLQVGPKNRYFPLSSNAAGAAFIINDAPFDYVVGAGVNDPPPTRSKAVINTNTAMPTAMAGPSPSTLLALADEVIE